MKNSLPLAALLLTTMLAGCGKQEAPAAEKPTPVRVQHASTGPAVPPIDTSGIVTTKHEMRLSFKMGGVVRRIYVQEGDVVKQGQRLAEIELTEVGSQVEQARQMADKAQRDLKRGENLYSDQVISLEQLQDLRTQAAMAAAQYNTAQFNLGYSVITAPRDGKVLRKLGEKREIRMDAFPGQPMTGTIVEVASAADERTGMFPIEVQFDSPPPRLVSGLVTRLRLAPTTEAPPLTYVPMSALVEGDGDRASVFVVDGAKTPAIAERRSVRVAFITADSIALESGLATGETVVTDGALFLENGEPVEIVRDTSKQVVNAATPA